MNNGTIFLDLNNTMFDSEWAVSCIGPFFIGYGFAGVIAQKITYEFRFVGVIEQIIEDKL